jgi:ABC-type multidrug transport system ATPase subunit
VVNIALEKAGRRFNKEWIFRDVNIQFTSQDRAAIVGGNGSGKSTFLQMLSGFLMPSEGKINYQIHNQNIEGSSIFRHVSVCSPFLELYEDYTVQEHFRFHARLQKMRHNITEKHFVELLQLSNIRNKPLRNYSSGMRQRVKLALAILSDTPILMLDEPCTNLDRNATQWYQQLLTEHAEERMVLVSSNRNEDELFLCNSTFNVEDYKK